MEPAIKKVGNGMFSVFVVLARRRVRSGDPKAEEKQSEVKVADVWLPNMQPNETLDLRLESEGLPNTAVLTEFCFSKRTGVSDDFAGLLPPSLPFVFTLTGSSGERTHCFCLRAYKPDDIATSHRLDVGGEWIEASLLISKEPYHHIFPAALQICRVRRALDRQGYLDFMEKLYAADLGGYVQVPRVVVESPTLGLSCKYEFSTTRDPKMSCLFDSTNAQMLHYLAGAILLERRVVLVAKHERILSEVAYALVHLCCSDTPLRMYPYNFVPILPLSMIEQGLGNPAPYVVGLLRRHLKEMDAIKELGDIVIADLDQRVVRLSPGGAAIMPLGLDSSIGDSAVPRKDTSSQELQHNPWLDVTTPFSKDVQAAYGSRDVDLLVAAVRSCVLIVAVGRVGQHLEDTCLKLFHLALRKTQLHASTIGVNENKLSSILGNRGYSGLRNQLQGQQITNMSTERGVSGQVRASVTELTSSSGKGRPELVNRTTSEIAKKSFDATVFTDGIQASIHSRLVDSAGRNWKHAYKALGLLSLALKSGSELVVAYCWDELALIFELTRFSLQGVVGVPSRVIDLVQKRSTDLYSKCVDLHYLAFARGLQGHVIVQKHAKQSMQKEVVRIPPGRDLMYLLETSKMNQLASETTEIEERPATSNRPLAVSYDKPPITGDLLSSENPFDGALVDVSSTPTQSFVEPQSQPQEGKGEAKESRPPRGRRPPSVPSNGPPKPTRAPPQRPSGPNKLRPPPPPPAPSVAHPPPPPPIAHSAAAPPPPPPPPIAPAAAPPPPPPPPSQSQAPPIQSQVHPSQLGADVVQAAPGSAPPGMKQKPKRPPPPKKLPEHL